ncbi:hypothetical protein ACH437_08985 [Streptomyces xinghaiensis]|uniref:hypothetical protein n=1 Tax=Streptomyces xinghaiensis TaxID=1038928 RepID=UPI0037B96F50
MNDLIRLALGLVWAVLDALWPPQGRRRAQGPAVAGAAAQRPGGGRRRPLPSHRSPYSLPEPLDGHALALARPYFVACEREQVRQRERRRTLLLALEGVDIGAEIIHGVRVGAGKAR